MKYIAYCRKSTDEKDRQILSIESQVQELTEFSKKQNLEIIEFISEAKTAKKPGREKFQELLRKIEEGEAQGIISWHPDRLARNSIDGGKIIYLLDTGKLVDLKFPSFWFENSPQGKFVLNIAFGQSKYYVDNLSENVKRGMKTLLRNGVMPAKSPHGYKYNHQAKKHEIDPLLSKVIRKAFRMFAKGSNQTEISKFLFKYGVTKKSGKPLGLNEVVRMLTNPFYIGKFMFKGEWYEGTHELFTSKKLFDKVQRELEARKRTKFKRQKFAFTGLMKCGECGASITAEQRVKKSGLVFRYYRCTKKLATCTQKYMPELKLAKQFRKTIMDVAIPMVWAKDWLKWLEKDEIKEGKLKEENIAALAENIKKLDEKLNTLLDGYLGRYPVK